jgi:glycosyltransferase involved in cell wall biosynthesis
MRPIVNLEIASLAERHHTGIPNVTKHLARELLGDATVEPGFWLNRQRLPVRLVEEIVALDGAPHLWWLAGRVADAQAPAITDALSVGIYPSHKWHRRFFEQETLIVHDLTAVTMPQYHSEATVTWENSRLLPDILTSDLVVAVSESTRQDIRDYFPQAAGIPVEVAHLAPCCGPPDQVRRVKTAPYIVVLGTLEPRKNVVAVLEMLQREPAWLDSFSFVFVGRWGWGASVADLVATYGLTAAVEISRVQFPGFLPDAERDVLVANASCLIYPSRYEGFGLPVLEALALGVPVVTGEGSSFAEAGGPYATYVDVDSPTALAAGLKAALRDTGAEAASARRDWAAQFSWWKTYERIRDLALETAARGRAASARDRAR